MIAEVAGPKHGKHSNNAVGSTESRRSNQTEEIVLVGKPSDNGALTNEWANAVREL
jgi:hypothetical protein